MSHERHCDHELWILVRQKLAVFIHRSQHPVSNQWVKDHYGRRHPEWMQSANVKTNNQRMTTAVVKTAAVSLCSASYVS